MFTDRTLKCQDCSAKFLFSAGEQEFFSTKGLVNQPKRCGNCRLVARLKRSGQDLGCVFEGNCTECGAVAKLPFKPKGARPIYCTECLRVVKFERTEETVEESVAV